MPFHKFVSLAAVTTIWMLLCPNPSMAKKIALVIGNGAYAQSRPLLNPVRDAKAISLKLKTLGFEVRYFIDRTKAEMENAFRSFINQADSAEIALVFYSGHGIQVKGKNYFVPTDAKLRDVTDVSFELIEINALIRAIEKRAKRTIVFLDACRDNPFVRSMRGYTRSGGARGLAPHKASLGTLVAYAAQPGDVAFDGDGLNSPFTTALLANVDRPGSSISQILTRVRKRVYEDTKGAQLPQDFNSLLEETYLTDRPSSDQQADQLRRRIAMVRERIKQLKASGASPGKAGAKLSLNRTTSAEAPKKPAIRYKVRQRIRDCKVCPEMIVVPAGSFLIGSPETEERRFANEGPQKKITIDRPFAIGRFEVTVDEFSAFVKDTGVDPAKEDFHTCWEWIDSLKGGRENKNRTWRKPGYRQSGRHPVTCISFYHAENFGRWLSKKTGSTYRLPSEAEWEYAARAGSKGMYHFGNSISTYRANFASYFKGRFGGRSSEKRWYGKTLPVKSFKPNKFGLYQMHGNAFEMVQDCFNFGHRLTPPDGQAYERPKCPKRIRKGGSWLEQPWHLRAARRWPFGPNWRDHSVGFRVVRELP